MGIGEKRSPASSKAKEKPQCSENLPYESMNAHCMQESAEITSKRQKQTTGVMKSHKHACKDIQTILM